MKFIYTENKTPLFGDVEFGQFFVNMYGCFCQKTGSCSYNIITDANGKLNPMSGGGLSVNAEIIRILPRVSHIEF